MGQLVSDGTRDYVWVTDATNGGDVIQNLNLAVSDPASQPYVTAVGGTSLGHGTQTLGPPPTEQVWNDALYYSEGAGGGGISTTFAMPAYQQALGHGHRQQRDPLRERGRRLPRGPRRVGRCRPQQWLRHLRQRQRYRAGTPRAGPAGPRRCGRPSSRSWRRPTATRPATALLNPALYLLAQQSPGTYLNDVTSGNNDYNATAGGAVPGHARLRHGDRAGHAGGVGAGRPASPSSR